MNLERFRGDDNAVSPVIGVILMVAITVILAAVIASFVLGLGQQNPGVTAQAGFSLDYTSGDSVTVVHESGDTLEGSNLYLRGSDLDSEESWSSGEIGAGDTQGATLDLGTSPSDGDPFEIQVVYETDEGSNTLQTLEGEYQT